MRALTFIGRLAALVPHVREHQLTYHGCLAPASPLRDHVVLRPPSSRPSRSEAAGAAPNQPSEGPKFSWADLMRRVWSKDVLKCTRCGSRRLMLAAIIERRVARLASSHPRGRFEVYRTSAGLRVLAVHDVFDPAGEAARALFVALGADKRYVAMCRRQRCVRARLTAQPWRIGIQGHLRPRPGVWPVSPERRPERAAWLSAYDAAPAGYAACRHERTLGTGAERLRAAAVRELHDELCRSRSELPLASARPGGAARRRGLGSSPPTLCVRALDS